METTLPPSPPRSPRVVRAFLVGLGNVHRQLLTLLETKRERLADQYGIEFRVCGAADSSGVAFHQDGLDLAQLRQLKASGGRMADLEEFRDDLTVVAAAGSQDYDLLLEASAVNLETGQPGLGATREALRRGIPVVLANKAPLVLAFGELEGLARDHGAGLSYSATVCGGLPVVNLLHRDLVACRVRGMRGVVNSTTNFLLVAMAEGRSYGDALAEAQRLGVAEADPTLDVEGWDAANKLVIMANTLLRRPTQPAYTLEDLEVEGITQLKVADLENARRAGEVYKLVAEAQPREDGRFHLTVSPQRLPKGDFLAECEGWAHVVEIDTDLFDRIQHKISEEGGTVPTAAAMLRDAVNFFRQDL